MSIFHKKKEVDMTKEIFTNDILQNAQKTMFKMEEIERAVEGKIIKSLSTNGYGTIIHFEDGTTFSSINGVVKYDGIFEI